MILVLMTITVFFGCADTIEFNAPALQANKNYQLWRAKYYGAEVLENGNLLITAGNNIEKMSLLLPALKEGTYQLTDHSISKIEFVTEDKTLFATYYPSETSALIDTGEVTITQIEDQMVSGTFRCIANTADGTDSVGFNQGIFYQIPVKQGDKSK